MDRSIIPKQLLPPQSPINSSKKQSIEKRSIDTSTTQIANSQTLWRWRNIIDCEAKEVNSKSKTFNWQIRNQA
jgi:hypothetical protein